MARGYGRVLAGALSARLLTVGLAVAAAGLAFLTFGAVDKELLPREDRGRLFVSLSGPDGVGYTYMDRQAAIVEEALLPLREAGEIEADLQHRRQLGRQPGLRDRAAGHPGTSATAASSRSPTTCRRRFPGCRAPMSGSAPRTA